jgi:hypothetical protein
MEIIWVIVVVLVIFYVINKNKKANPDLLKNKPAVFEEFKVNGNAEAAYSLILQFGQTSDYKIDHVNNESRQLILNYVPKMGEQTNGSFFPIWVNEIDAQTCNVCVGAKDKSAISMKFEERNALGKLLPRLQATLHSVQAYGGSGSSSRDTFANSSWDKARNLSDDEYQIYLVKKYNVEKNDVLGKYIVVGKSYESVAEALSVAHEKDLDVEAKRANAVAAEQEKINSDTSKPQPNSHVKCPDCRQFVRKEANRCRHCSCKLIPQNF